MRLSQRLLPALAALGLLLGSLPAQAQSADLGALRAGFLLNFAKLASWPEARFAAADAPLRLCLLADDASLDALSKSLSGKPVGSHALELVPVSNAAAIRAGNCHLAYLGPEAQPRYGELMAALAASGALIVDEGSRFSWPDGMIRLFVEDGRMRFELNLDAVEKAGLKIDPRLIRLARLAAR